MAIRDAWEAEQISAVREFNRFYTARLGLLRKRHLDGDFSLTEARILYEVATKPGLTASSLRNALGLDAGYLSRSLAQLTKRKLVRTTASREDGRQKFLALSPSGESAIARLNQQSEQQIRELLERVGTTKRAELLEALSTIRSILRESNERSLRIVRLSEANDDARGLLQEYYEAVNVVQRDPPDIIQTLVNGRGSGVWLAYLDERAVGCVALKKLPSVPMAGECKRLYVQSAARGLRIADRMMDALEDFARRDGLRWIYLDSYDDLKAAIAIYRKRGYRSCERYNDNPQATVFLRKRLAPPRSAP